MKLKVTTIRHEVNNTQFSEFVQTYHDTPKAKARIDVDSLLKTGKSHTKIVDEYGKPLETIIEVTK